MKNRLIKWFDKKSGGKLKAKHHAAADEAWNREQDELAARMKREFAALPGPYSPISLSNSNNQQHAKDLFFGKLPWELRRQVLVAAFGDQIVHMNLTWNYPIAARVENETRPGLHCCYVSTLYSFPDEIRRDHSLPKCWQWQSCVCHRLAPPHLRRPREKLTKTEPFGNTCTDGRVSNCKLWPGEYPAKCQLGIFGWLLSCRQAYVEGIDVLYRTNIIHTSSIYLLLHVQRLLPLERLASITSLEVVWPFNFNQIRDGIELVDKGNSVKQILDALSGAFPRLRYLSLALTVMMNVDVSRSPHPILKEFDQFVRRTTTLQDCVLSLPPGAYAHVIREARVAAKDDSAESRAHDEIWRFLDGEGYDQVGIEPESICRNRVWPEFKSNSDTNRNGYWVTKGGFADLATVDIPS